MANKRIYELAKDYNVSSKAMVDIIKSLGFPVKSHSSTASDEILKAVHHKFASDKEEVKKEIAKKKEKFEARQRAETEAARKKQETQKKIMAELRKVDRKETVSPDKKLSFKKRREKRRKKKERAVDLTAVRASFKKTMSTLDLAKRKNIEGRKESQAPSHPK